MPNNIVKEGRPSQFDDVQIGLLISYALVGTLGTTKGNRPARKNLICDASKVVAAPIPTKRREPPAEDTVSPLEELFESLQLRNKYPFDA